MKNKYFRVGGIYIPYANNEIDILKDLFQWDDQLYARVKLPDGKIHDINISELDEECNCVEEDKRLPPIDYISYEEQYYSKKNLMIGNFPTVISGCCYHNTGMNNEEFAVNVWRNIHGRPKEPEAMKEVRYKFVKFEDEFEYETDSVGQLIFDVCGTQKACRVPRMICYSLSENSELYYNGWAFIHVTDYVSRLEEELCFELELFKGLFVTAVYKKDED